MRLEESLLHPAVTLVLLLSGCGGAGVKDAESQARAAQASARDSTSTGFSILSLSKGNVEFVQKRLNGGLGKTKAEEIVTFGQPFQCHTIPAGGEMCGWYDSGMSEGGTSDATQHRVFYTFDHSGKATEWNHQGTYDKHTRREALLPSPSSSSQDNN